MIKWKAIGDYVLEVLPQFITIVTVIASTIVQIGASKRETKRAIESYKHTLEAERVKSEEARKAAILEKQLSEHKENYAALSAQYAKILDAFYPNCGKTLSVSASKTIYAEAMKMMGYCSPESDLYASLQTLTDYLYQEVIKVDTGKPADCTYVQTWIRSIAYHLHDMTISRSIEQGTLQTKKPEE